MVNQIVEIFNEEPEFLLTIAPEGTRSKVDKLKSGFYHIAHQANVPIVPVTFDYSQKTVQFHPPIPPDTPKEEAIRQITRYFKEAHGKHPELGL